MLGAEPKPKPAAAPEAPQATGPRQETEVALKALAQATVMLAVRVVPAWGFCTTMALTEPLQLDPSVPFDNAGKLISMRAWHGREGMRTLHHWQGSFWDWNGMCYRERDPEEVRSFVWKLLAAAEKYGKGGKVVRFEPNPANVTATIDALKGVTHLSDAPMPGWLGAGRPTGDPCEIVACQNGLLHVESRVLLPHTPRFWSANALDFGYDPSARAPRFLQFLEELWPNDLETQECVLEMFGYCLTDLTKHQKAFMFVDPPRGGRGTIGRVLKGLIGEANYIGTSLRAFSEQFGMESFVGKKVAVFSDARLDGVPQRNLTSIAERLLSITGEDEMHINRKNAKYWEGHLTARVVLFSNELLRFQDDSGALAGRFLTFRMTQSFRGREDPNLTTKLLAERAGILNLALDALDRVRQRGLRQCKTGEEMRERLGTLTSDIAAFVEERCVVGPAYQATLDDLFKVWGRWCFRKEVRHAWGSNPFSEKLFSAVPTLRRSRPRKGNPNRAVTVNGISVRLD
jgi:putative DNA primase/helicase